MNGDVARTRYSGLRHVSRHCDVGADVEGGRGFVGLAHTDSLTQTAMHTSPSSLHTCSTIVFKQPALVPALVGTTGFVIPTPTDTELFPRLLPQQTALVQTLSGRREGFVVSRTFILANTNKGSNITHLSERLSCNPSWSKQRSFTPLSQGPWPTHADTCGANI